MGSTNRVLDCDGAQEPKRGDTGIEPATSCTQSRNHTTRPIARHCTGIRVCLTDKKGCTLGDSNPRPQRGSELESDALTNSAKGALLRARSRFVRLVFSVVPALGSPPSPVSKYRRGGEWILERGYSSVVEQSVAAR